MKGDVVIKDPLVLHERIFALIGSWPEKRVRTRFAIMLMYSSLYIVMQYWDFYDSMKDFDLLVTVTCLLETVVTITTYVTTIIMQRNKQLKYATIGLRGYLAQISLLNNEEKLLYQGHSKVAYRIGKYMIFGTVVIDNLLYFHPLIVMLLSHPGHDNSTLPHDLPFRMHIIFDITDIRIYCLLYLYQFPCIFFGIYHATEAGFITNLVLHHCGRLSVLSYRIRIIPMESHRAFKNGIQKAVAEHLELIESWGDLNDTLVVILFLELLSCCSRLGLAMFVMLIKIGIDISSVITFGIYSLILVCWLFLFCYIGEQVIFESQKVGDAFYAIDWTAVGNNDRKLLLICILNGYQTLYLTAGKVYIFSLTGFTAIMKTSMGCLSMLQASM